MLSRAAFDSVQNIFAIIAFVLIGGGFLFFLFKAIFMKKKKVDRLSSLPFDEKETTRPKKQDPNRNDSHE